MGLRLACYGLVVEWELIEILASDSLGSGRGSC